MAKQVKNDYQRGWDDCEAFMADAILRADSGYQTWLDLLNHDARNALNEQQNQMAAQAADDDDNH